MRPFRVVPKRYVRGFRFATRLKKDCSLLWQRNQAVWRIKQVGLKQWKRESTYHRRNLVETVGYRFKVTFGDELRARTIQNQKTELALKCKILNLFAKLGFE